MPDPGSGTRPSWERKATLSQLTQVSTILPFSRLADRIIKHAPGKGGKSQGEGSVLGGLGNILMGDN